MKDIASKQNQPPTRKETSKRYKNLGVLGWEEFKTRLLAMPSCRINEFFEQLPLKKEINEADLVVPLYYHGGYREVRKKLKEDGVLDKNFPEQRLSFIKKEGMTEGLRTAERTADSNGSVNRRMRLEFGTVGECRELVTYFFGELRKVDIDKLQAYVKAAADPEALEDEQGEARRAGLLLRYIYDETKAWKTVEREIQAAAAMRAEIKKNMQVVEKAEESVQTAFKNIFGAGWKKEYDRQHGRYPKSYNGKETGTGIEKVDDLMEEREKFDAKYERWLKERCPR